MSQEAIAAIWMETVKIGLSGASRVDLSVQGFGDWQEDDGEE